MYLKKSAVTGRFFYVTKLNFLLTITFNILHQNTKI